MSRDSHSKITAILTKSLKEDYSVTLSHRELANQGINHKNWVIRNCGRDDSHQRHREFSCMSAR